MTGSSRAGWSLRVRLTVWNITVMAAVLAVYVSVVAWTIAGSLASGVDADLRGESERVSAMWLYLDAIFDGTPPRRPSPRPMASPTPRMKSSRFFEPRIIGPDGEPLLPMASDQPWDPESMMVSLGGHEVFSTIEVRQEPVRVFSAPLRSDGEIVAVIQVAHPLSEQARLVAGLYRTPVTLIPLALLVAALGGIFLTGRALRPIRDITMAAAQISAQDLSRRLEVRGNDELSELARTFNGMVARLQDAFTRLETAYSRLESAYEAQRRFTGDASHELRTPLTRVKGRVSLALSRERTAEEYRQQLQAIQSPVDEMQVLLEDLLLLARADAGLELDARPVAIRELFEEVTSEAGEDGPRVEIVAPPELSAPGDRRHLKRILINLVSNARRHTPPTGTITLAAHGEPHQVVVEVRDTGEGISPEHLPRLTDRFYRVDPARARADGGVGLGLAICRSLVESHGGNLGIESQPGKGATVRFTLPIRREPNDPSLTSA